MSIMIKKFLFIIFITFFINQVHAEEVKKMGKHKDWETYIIKSDAGKVCFAQSKPVLQAPKTNQRVPKCCGQLSNSNQSHDCLRSHMPRTANNKQ